MGLQVILLRVMELRILQLRMKGSETKEVTEVKILSYGISS
jgi:hypothetical protein